MIHKLVKQGLTHGFVVQLESVEDRDYYVRQDPAHIDFVESLKGIVEQIVSVDFTHGIY